MRQLLLCGKYYIYGIWMEYVCNVWYIMLTGNQCKWGKIQSSKTMSKDNNEKYQISKFKVVLTLERYPCCSCKATSTNEIPFLRLRFLEHYQLLRTCMHLETRRPDGCWCRRRRRGQGRTWRPRRSPSREWRLLPRGHQEGGGGEVCANGGNIWSGRGKRSNGIKEFEKEFLNKQEWHQLGEHVGGVGGGGGGHHVRQDPADQQVRQQDFWSGDHLPLFQIPRMRDVRCGGALVLLCTHIPPSCILTLTGEQTQVCSYLDSLNSLHTNSLCDEKINLSDICARYRNDKFIITTFFLDFPDAVVRFHFTFP